MHIDGVRPTFKELKLRLLEHGCEIRQLPVYRETPGATEEYIFNPSNDLMMPISHWVDGEEVAPTICSLVCRRLGIDENELKLDTEHGAVRVANPEDPPLN